MAFKKCENCGELNGVRTLECKKCANRFSPRSDLRQQMARKQARRAERVEDWTTLKAGDRIKVLNGSGPYWIGADGLKHSFTDRGIYIVTGLDRRGINCRAEGKRDTGYVFLYMGKHVRSPLVPTVFRRKHKLLKLPAYA